MSRSAIVAAALALFLVTSALAQQVSVIRIDEIDDNAKTMVVDDKFNIVDINSRLVLTFDRSELNKYLKDKGFVDGTSDLVDRISVLTEVLQMQNESLDSFQKALATRPPADASDADWTAYWAAVRTASAPFVQLVEIISKSPTMRQQLNADMKQLRETRPQDAANPLMQLQVVYKVAADEARRLQSELDAQAREKGVYVQLGGWVESRPIHIDGFDDYPQGERFVVERFSLVLSDEEKQRLAAYAALANEVNDKGKKAILDWYRNGPDVISNALSSTPTATCVTSLANDAEAAKTAWAANVAAAKAKLDDMKTQALAYKTFVDGLRTKYGPGGTAGTATPDQFLIGTNDDLLALVQKTQALPGQLRADLAALKATLSAAQQQAADVKPFLDKVEACAKQAGDDAAGLRGSLVSHITNLIAGQQFNSAALELGDKVKQLSVEQLPDSVTIPLVNTGQRKAGEHVTFKFAVGTAADGRQVIYTRDLVMERILWHFDLKANMIWADPKKTTDVDNFQTAPAYNVLLKRGSRKNPTYNNLFDPGIGLNLSALDFNHDDTQELGLALTFSAFRDLIGVGYGYNVSYGSAYWFFGLRLPLPGLTLPAAQMSGTTP